MSKIYYISDLHFWHSNVINFDNRPFKDVEEMNNILIENWNSVVEKGDTVYILGDFCWSAKDEEWINILNKLNGSKHLILGNHDSKRMSSKVKKKFNGIYDYKEIKDNGRRVIMCHYPMPFYRSDYNSNVYMLYGHVHTTIENDFMEYIKDMIKEKDLRGDSTNKCQLYNVGCMMPWMKYFPRTLDEIIDGYNKEKKDGH